MAKELKEVTVINPAKMTISLKKTEMEYAGFSELNFYADDEYSYILQKEYKFPKLTELRKKYPKSLRKIKTPTDDELVELVLKLILWLVKRRGCELKVDLDLMEEGHANRLHSKSRKVSR